MAGPGGGIFSEPCGSRSTCVAVLPRYLRDGDILLYKDSRELDNIPDEIKVRCRGLQEGEREWRRGKNTPRFSPCQPANPHLPLQANRRPEARLVIHTRFDDDYAGDMEDTPVASGSGGDADGAGADGDGTA